MTNNAFSSGFNKEINIDQLEQLAKKEKVKKEKQPKDYNFDCFFLSSRQSAYGEDLK